MGEMQSRTPEQIVKGMTPRMRSTLMTGGTDGRRVIGAAVTRNALRARGLVGSDQRWTADGWRVALWLVNNEPGWNPAYVKTIDELHQLAVDEDKLRFPETVAATPDRPGEDRYDKAVMSLAKRAAYLATIDDITRFRALALNSGVKDHLTGRLLFPGHETVPPVTSFHRLAYAVRNDTRNPFDALRRAMADELRNPGTTAATRPAIVDQILNSGPVYPGNGPLDFRVRSEDYNQLREYLLLCPADPPADTRVVRRAQYEALKTVSKLVDEWRALGGSFPVDVQSKADTVVGAIREMLAEAAQRLNVPWTPDV